MVTAFIPVRGGSRSIPLKNIKPFCGKPLVCWNIEALEDCGLVDEIIVATDSDEIEKTVSERHYKKTVIYRRLAENAVDTASTESVMLEYIDYAKLSPDRIFMLVQATSPLTGSIHFKEALEMYNKGSFDSILSCVRNYRFFWSAGGRSINYDYRKRPRRQEFDGLLMENGAFYINTVENILESKNRLSGKIGIYEMPEYTAAEIDEPDDWVVLENLMRRHVLSGDETQDRNSLDEEAKTDSAGENAPADASAQEVMSFDREISAGKIKLFMCDIDGTLTDGGMYYSEKGDELKKFNTRDGMGLQLLRQAGVKTGIITSENTDIAARRAEKLKIDFLFQGEQAGGKLEAAEKICEIMGISMENAAYIGDDINCLELLSAAGLKACPSDACGQVKAVPGIYITSSKGGEGCVREFAEFIINKGLV